MFSQKITDYEYELIPLEPPLITRNNRQYICSEKFRINSNGSVSDLWLIYKDVKDNSTWNIAIMKRVNLSNTFDEATFNNFFSNDKETAWQYAFDLNLLKKNGADVDSELKFDVLGVPFNTLLVSAALEKKPVINIEVKCQKYYITAQIKNVLKKALHLNTTKLTKGFKSGAVILDTKPTKRMGYKLCFSVDCAKFLELLAPEKHTLTK